MAPADSVLLPKLFPSDLVSLGQIVHNPLSPNVNTYRKGCEKVKDEEISKYDDAEKPYKAIVSVDRRGRFDISLTKFLGAMVKARSGNLVSIEAEKLENFALKDATDLLRRITADEDARNWINDMVLNKTPCYLVIGLQLLHNAQFERVVLNEASGGAHVTVPIEKTGQLPLHFKGNLSADKFGKSTGKLSGIFGIEVQKLKSEVSTTQKTTLQGDTRWHWTYQRKKGTQEEEDKELTIKLEDVNLDELVELRKQEDAEEEEDEEEDED